jgi:hypothetical protein
MAARLGAAGYLASRSTRWGIYRNLADRWAIPTVPATQMTVSRGWVDGATTRFRLPVAVAALGLARSVIHTDTRTRIRGSVLARRRRRPPPGTTPPPPAA